MSILTGPAIRAAIASEIIAITPHDDDQIDQAGVTLHLPDGVQEVSVSPEPPEAEGEEVAA